MLKLIITILLFSQIRSKAEPESPIMISLAYFVNRMAAKIDINMMFHQPYKAYDNGICSSKGGPYCKFINPELQFKVQLPLTPAAKTLRNQLFQRMTLLAQDIKQEMYSKEDTGVIYVASKDIVEYDDYIQQLI